MLAGNPDTDAVINRHSGCGTVVFQDFSSQAPEMPFYFRQFFAGPHENFHYVVGDPDAGVAAIIDPAFELERIWSATAADGLRIEEAWFTHGHWDHIGGVPEIFERGVHRIRIHKAANDIDKVQEARTAGEVVLIDDEDTWSIGDVPVQAIHTPGHQPESTCFRVGPADAAGALFGGDCLFVDSCGRTDFAGGDTDAMFASMAKVRRLEGDLHLMPGHHYADAPHRPLAAQRVENPALATTDRDAFEALPFLRG